MGAFVKVARVGDVPPGKMLTVTLDGQPVVLVNVDGASRQASPEAKDGHTAQPVAGQRH